MILYKDVKNIEEYKHIEDPNLLYQEANARNTQRKLLKLIKNCGFIHFDELENTIEIFHCSNFSHKDNDELVKIWDFEEYEIRKNKTDVRKHKLEIKDFFSKYKIIQVSKCICEYNVYCMLSETMPQKEYYNNQDRFIVRSIRVIFSEKEYFESRIFINDD